MPCAHAKYLGQFILNDRKFFYCHIPECFHVWKILGNTLNRLFTFSSAIVVGRACKVVLHARIANKECVLCKIDWNVVDVERSAVNEKRIPLSAQDGSELVHDADL